MVYPRLVGIALLVVTALGIAAPPRPSAAQGSQTPPQIAQALGVALDAIQARLDAGDSAGARAAYDAFENQWEAVENSVRSRSRTAYQDIEDAMRVLRRALYQGDGDPVSALGAVRGQLLAFASGGPAPAAAAPPPQSPQAPTSQGPESALVLTRKVTALGEILADRDGRTLYVFTDDEPGSPGRLPTLSCVDDCADDWPPLEFNSTRRPLAGEGVDQARLGTVRRDGRTTQITYAGRPLYYWAGDYAADDLRGQGVGGNWYVLSPRGDVIQAMDGVPKPTFPSAPATTLTIAQTALGPIVADGAGQSLYLFKDDGSVNYATSTCTSVSCTGDWPPLQVVGQPTVGEGLDPSRVATISRDDGSQQVTYAGYPLYKWSGDFNPGDIRGQLIGPEGGDWFLLTPAGERIVAPDPAWVSAPVPAVARSHRGS